MTRKPLSAEEHLLRDAKLAPVVRATTKADVLNAPIGALVEAPADLWEELGMSVPDDPATYPLPEDL